jgi:hypothetical protein
MRLVFGPWEPDKAEHLQQGLETADNVYPSPTGYRPIPSFDAMTAALDEGFQGGAAFVASDGTVQLLAGTATDLYRFTSGLAWDSILDTLTAGRWYFTQFNDYAIATYGGNPVEIDLLAGTAQALGGSPPVANLCATVRDFVVLADDSLVTWSGFEDRAEWTAGTNQSGSQTMLAGGTITGLTGGEYGLIFQRFRIVRMSYAGVPTIWQFDEISANVGCMTAGSLAQAGRLTFFLSHRGFMLTDGNDVRPIGAERVDRTFFAAYTHDDISSFMYAAVDPKNNIVSWIMPGKSWNYHWLLDQWTTTTWDVRAAFTGFTAGLTLEDLDTPYPDMDEMEPSLDSPEFQGGVPQFLLVNASDEIGTASGDNLEATFLLPNMELVPGREARISQVRPITDATNGITIGLRQRARLGDTASEQTFSALQASGDMDCRVSGRYLRPRVTIAFGEDWSYFQGLDLNMMAGGGRR